MSLKSELTKLETNTNNVKQASNNIDVKLVELGGQQATDLFDIPNKMCAMITDNYKKVAVISLNVTKGLIDSGGIQSITIPLNLKFKPTRIIVTIENAYVNPKDFFKIDSKFNNNESNAKREALGTFQGPEVSIWISNVSAKNLTLNYYSNIQKELIFKEVIAIG